MFGERKWLQVPSKLLQELENEVPQPHPEHFIIVTDDVGRIFFDLDERFCFLQQDNVALGRVFHLDITEAMLLQKREKRGEHLEIRGPTEKVGSYFGLNGTF